MLGWMSRCWGGFGVNSQFERARVRSIVTDWKVPEDGDLCSKPMLRQSSSTPSRAKTQKSHIKPPWRCSSPTCKSTRRRPIQSFYSNTSSSSIRLLRNALPSIASLHTTAASSSPSRQAKTLRVTPSSCSHPHP